MKDRVKENVIEWLEGDKTATCTLSQKRFINRIRKMSKNAEASVEILAENEDGSIMARIPLRAIHLFILGSNNRGFKGEPDES